MSAESVVKTPGIAVSLTVKNSVDALAFYKKMLGATELYKVTGPDGSVAHAEFAVRGTKLYISDEAEEFKAFAMPEGRMASCLFCIASDDCDGDYKRAIEAGAISITEPVDQFHGVRNAAVLDPFGYRWCFNQVIEKGHTGY